jgi:hypothetical protein
MARHKVKRYNGFDGSDVSSDQSSITPKRVDINNPGSYTMPMPISQEDASVGDINQSMGNDYMNNGPTPGAATDVGPQAPITDYNAPIESAPKPRIVSKKELAASGYDNLRDFLNAEKGLSRRGESAPRKPKPSDASKPSAAKPTKVNYTSSEWDDKNPTQVRAMNLQSGQRPKEEPLENVYPEQFLGGGAGLGIKAIANLAKGLAAKQATKEIAKEVLPAVADRVTPLKFLGKTKKDLPEMAQKEISNPQLKLGMKRGGKVKHKAVAKHTEHKPKGGRGDGIATKGFTKGRYL